MFDGKVIEDFYLKDFKGEPEEMPLELDYVPVKRKTDYLNRYKVLRELLGENTYVEEK